MKNGFYLLLITMVTTILGCSGGQRQAPSGLLPVSGRVMLDGSPAAHVTMTFTPEKGTNAMGGYAVTDKDGNFKVKHLSNVEGKDGLEKGTYDIVFSKLTAPGGGPIPEGKTAADVGATESLPRHLSTLNPESPLFSLRVDGPKTNVEFNLKTKR